MKPDSSWRSPPTQGEILKLTGLYRAAYAQVMQRLREWRSDQDLNLAVADYVTAVRRLPEGVNRQAVVDGFLQRHPSGVPQNGGRGRG